MSANKTAIDPGLPKDTPTEAYWQCPPHPIASRQSLILQSKASVTIIGSGITAASVAYYLLKRCPDLEVIMLEARTICSGATGRNGGHCKDVSYKTYRKLKSQYGRDAAMQLVKFRLRHVDVTRQIAHELNKDGFGDGHFRDVKSLTAVFDEDTLRDFESNLHALVQDFPEYRHHYSVLNGEEAEKTYGLIGAAGVITSPAAALWPYRLVTSVLQQLLTNHRNFSLEALTPVSSVTASKDLSRPYLVHTSRGVVRTQHVIHCTNAYAGHLLPQLAKYIVPVRGQMTAFAPSDSFPRLGHVNSWSLCWNNGGFDYMTQASESDGLVFLGGGVEHAAAAGVVDFGCVDDSNLNQPALKHLSSVLPRHFKAGPGAVLKQAWTGVMGFTSDGFPLVGMLPQELSDTKVSEESSGHEWIAAGFSGYGMVHCWHSGRAIAEMIFGQPQESINNYFPTELFRCSRKRLESMDVEGMRSQFYKNAPAAPRSRI